MKNFKNTINRLNFGFGLSNIAFAQDTGDPCCDAFNFWSKDQYSMNEAIELVRNPSSVPDPNTRTELFSIQMIDNTHKFINDYCLCKSQPVASTGVSTEVGGGTAPTGNSPQCQNQLDKLLSGSNNFVDSINKILNSSRGNFSAAHKKVLRLWGKTMDKFKDFSIDFLTNLQNNPDFTGYTPPSNRANYPLKDFLDDMCRMKNNSINFKNVYNLLRGAFAVELDNIAGTMFGSIVVSPSDVESLTADCAPSTGDESVISLLGALGVGAASVTVVGYLGAILKGNVKKCADKRQAAKKATTQLLALLGAGVGSFSATQVSEAEIVDRVEDIIIKDCEGRLPYSCGEGGFEGDDDEGGEPVDPPSGGEVGGIGGGLL